MTHGPPISRCQAKRTVAPCGATIRPWLPGKPAGDSWSASTRFITCKHCLRMGKKGAFRLLYRWEQLGMGV